MNPRELFIGAYVLKQEVDGIPQSEVRAFYWGSSFILCFLMYQFLQSEGIHQQLLKLIRNILDNIHFEEYATTRDAMPGQFPSDGCSGTHLKDNKRTSMIEKSERSTSGIEPADVRSSETLGNTMPLQREYDRLKDELEQAKAQLRQHRDGMASKASIAAELAQLKEGINSLQKSKRDDTVISFNENQRTQIELQAQSMRQELGDTKSQLTMSHKRVADMIEQETLLREEVTALQNQVIGLQNATTNRPNDSCLGIQQHDDNCITWAQHEAVLREQREKDRKRHENMALGSAMQNMQKMKSNYDTYGPKQGSQLQQKCHECISLSVAYKAQIDEFQVAHNQEVARLGAEIAELRGQSTTQQHRVTQDDVRIASLQSCIQIQNQQIHELSFALGLLQQEITKKDVKLEAEAQLICRLREGCQDASNECDDLKGRLEFVTRESQSMINDLKIGNLRQNNRLQELEKERANAEFYMNKASFEIEQLKAKLSTKTEADPQSKERFEQEIKHLRDTIQLQTKELNLIKAARGTPDERLQNTINRLQHELRQERIERARAQGRFEESLKNLADASKKVDALQRSSKNASSNWQFARSSELEQKLKAQHNKELQSTTNKLQSRISQLETAALEQTQSQQSLNGQISKLEEQVQSLEWFIKHKDEDIQQKEQAIIDLDVQLKQAYNHVDGVKVAFETTRSMLEARVTELTAQLPGQTGVQQQPTLRAAKRNLDAHYADDGDEDNDNNTPSVAVVDTAATQSRRIIQPLRTQAAGTLSSHISNNNPFAALAQATLAPTLKSDEPASKRNFTAEKDTLDYELFDGPMPNIEAMVAQDEENARAEQELEDALNEYMG